MKSNQPNYQAMLNATSAMYDMLAEKCENQALRIAELNIELQITTNELIDANDTILRMIKQQ